MVRKLAPFLNIGPGDFLKEELEARNWKQEDFADILGMSLKSVTSLLRISSRLLLKQPSFFQVHLVNHHNIGQILTVTTG